MIRSGRRLQDWMHRCRAVPLFGSKRRLGLISTTCRLPGTSNTPFPSAGQGSSNIHESSSSLKNCQPWQLSSKAYYSTHVLDDYDEYDDDDYGIEPIHRILDGPSLQLGFGKLANQTHRSVVGTAGKTCVLTTVAMDDSVVVDDNNNNSTFLTVEYRQPAAAVGQIPTTNRLRRDSVRMTSAEILASRVIDRSLRPLLKEDDEVGGGPKHYHVSCSVQSCELWGMQQNENDETKTKTKTTTTTRKTKTSFGHPVTTALNSAAAAMAEHLTQPVAATCLALLNDGTVIQDPGPAIRLLSSSSSNNNNNNNDTWVVGELILAGTRDNQVVMLEWTGQTPLPESQWEDLLQLALATIQPILDTIEELANLRKQQQIMGNNNTEQSVSDQETQQQLRQSLGLPPLKDEKEDTSNLGTLIDNQNKKQKLLKEAIQYCQDKLQDPLLRLFGYDPKSSVKRGRSEEESLQLFIHDNLETLRTKHERGQREQIMQDEISRLLDEFTKNKTDFMILNDDDNDNSNNNKEVEPGKDASTTAKSSSTTVAYSKKWLLESVVDHLFRQALYSTSLHYGVRADGRSSSSSSNSTTTPNVGWKTIRPIKTQVPALPDAVHGSAIFARGETQVLCTVTLGAPSDGLPRTDPYQPTTNPKAVESSSSLASSSSNKSTEKSSYSSLPVGSLRFLRTQEALVSDLNSRKVKADKERTGDSGSLAEVQRAFLHYDFPSYSTGKIAGRSMATTDRRSIGHGALAERAILPILPDQQDFPYAIRIASEVTDSNGSSSMASVCGATLALLDAGVPIKEAVAGVSVGLAMNPSSNNCSEGSDDAADMDKYSLLLDITGTEDHFGYMDFKIAGTRHGVTALQLDVKKPLPVSILTQALDLARRGRGLILDSMSSQIGGLEPRPSTKESAPRVEVIRFDPQRKRDLVGPGGAVLRQLEDRYGVALDLTQEGQCLLFGANRKMVDQAKRTVMDLVADVEEGEVYTGTVIEIKDFGAIVELLRNKEGLLHISELATTTSPTDHPEGTAGFVREHVRIGDKIEVLCIGIDPVQGSVKLSQKLLQERRKGKR